MDLRSGSIISLPKSTLLALAYFLFPTTTCKNDPSIAWVVSFKNGNVGWGDKSDNGYAVCVRGQYIEDCKFKRDDTKEVVIDIKTNLMWQDNGDGNHDMTWQEAFRYAKKLNREKFAGFDDWRVPTIEELKTIVDYDRYNPAIRKEFKNVVSGYYWSSTTDASDSSGAWYVDFNGGGDGWYRKSASNYVRCVRAGQ